MATVTLYTFCWNGCEANSRDTPIRGDLRGILGDVLVLTGVFFLVSVLVLHPPIPPSPLPSSTALHPLPPSPSSLLFPLPLSSSA